MILKHRAKFVAGVVGLSMALSFVAPIAANAATIEELQAMIASLSAQLAALSGGSASVGAGYTFNTNLKVGSKGADVMNLQKTLNMSADTRVAATGAGSPGMETSTFGPATKAAVMKFQAKYGISPVAGYVGALTRAKLNSMGGTPPVVTPGLPTGGALLVSTGAQPANSLAPTSAARVPFTTVVLTAGSADVTVNSITVERSGLAQDAVFSGVVLLNSDGTQIGIAKTLNSNHQAMVGEPFVVKAGTSMTVTVAGNMGSSLGSYAGQVAGLNVVAVNTGASVSGSLPITGAMHTINASLTLGTVTMGTSSYDPGSSQSKEIGTTAYKFSGFRVTAGSAEQVRIWSVRWNQSGSAASGDLANVMVYVDGTGYPTTLSADGKYYSANFVGGLLLDKGLSKDIYIQGDIVGTGAAGRTVKFDLYKTTDLYISGVTYGYGITPPAGSNAVVTCSTSQACGNFSTGSPWFQANVVTVSSGSVTSITKAISVPAQNIAINVPNQVLGGFTTDIKGEPITVQSMSFSIATSGTWTSAGVITNITVVDSNGAVVAGPVDQASTCSNPCVVTFTDSVTLPIGPRTYTLKGKIPTNAPGGATVIVTTNPSAATAAASGWLNVTGQTTGNTISLANNGSFSMNTMTVKAAALDVSVSSNPTAQNIVAGGTVLFTNYQYDASQSGEDVRFSSVPLQLTFTGGNANELLLTSCQLWDGGTALNTGSNVLNPSDSLGTGNDATLTFDQSLIVAKGTIKTLAMKCNVSSSATTGSKFNWGVNNPPTATGVTSGGDITETNTDSVGPIMTVANGSFTVAVDSSSPSFALSAAGSTGVNMGVFKFRATNENVNLTKVGLVLTSGTSSDVGTVYLYQGATLLGSATFTGANTTATSTLNGAGLSLTKDTDVLITIKSDLRAIGTNDSGTEGQPVKVDVTNAEGSGVSSGTTLQVGGVTAGVNGVRMFKSIPVVASDTTLSGTGVADGRLMRFKVTANSAGPVGLYNLNFTMATSSFAAGGGVSAVKVMVYSDSSYSSSVSGTYGDATGQFGSTATPDASAPVLNYTAVTNPLQIPASTTYYFQVEATVTSVTTGTSVTTTLSGDAAYIAAAHLGVYQVSTTTGALADTNNDFIWSGNATTTAVFSSNDWANGFGVLGLPSGGFSTTRSQ